MGRSVKVRVSFQADIAFLTRLSRAVEMDPEIGKAAKKGLIASIADVQFKLMEVQRDRVKE